MKQLSREETGAMRQWGIIRTVGGAAAATLAALAFIGIIQLIMNLSTTYHIPLQNLWGLWVVLFFTVLLFLGACLLTYEGLVMQRVSSEQS